MSRPRRCGTRLWLAIAVFSVLGLQATAIAGWKAGTARTAITPKEPMWMSGYGSRTKPSEGAVHDLWAKTIALEDPAGKRAMIITLDLCGIDRDFSNRVRDALKSRYGLSKDRVVLACSHTHCGPVVGRNLLTMYKLDDAERKKIADYTASLESTLIELADRAINSLTNASLAWANGQCDFAVNRRANKEADVPRLKQELALAGPNDHDVPVLRVARADGTPLAILFGYACHCTTLDFNKFCGDYAGFTQLDLESRYPQAQAMFIAGCGADQNPIPRRTLALAETYGKQLAESVSRALSGRLEPITGALSSNYEEIPLAFDTLPTPAQIERDARSENHYIAQRARHLLELIDKNGALDTTYPYPIQTWRLDNLNWIFLGGEVVVDYASRLKRNLGTSHTWVSAYCNDVMAYIPSRRVLKEGGYEGGGAMLYYGLPAPWSDQVEEAIMKEIERQSRATNSAGASR